MSLSRAHNNHLAFLRDTDPANALFVIRLRLQGLEDELESQRAFMGAVGERKFQERLADLYRATGLVRARHTTSIISREDEIEAGTRAVLDRITFLAAGTRGAYFQMESEQSTVYNYRSSTRRQERSLRIPCLICDNSFQSYHIATLLCGHKFCDNCLVFLFQQSLVDETLFPPKCCKPISPDLVADFLTPELIQKHYEKKLELQTIDRTYCSDLQCNKFIPPNIMSSGVGVCKACWKRTCLTCKVAAHGSRPCVKDEATAKVLEIGEEKGWKRCPTCHTLVSLTTGCNHVQCRCGTHFCYRCGQTQVQCSCPLSSRYLVAPYTRVPHDVPEKHRAILRILLDSIVVLTVIYVLWYWILLFLAVAVALYTFWLTGRHALRGY